MRGAVGIAGIGLALAGLVTTLGVPQPAAAEYCRQAMPDRAAETRGYTFRAVVTGIRVEGQDPGLAYVTLAIQQLYANRDSALLAAAGSIELYSNGCDGFGLLGLQPGDDILMSTAVLDGAGPSTWNSAIWRTDGDRLQLAVLRSEIDRIWFTDDRRIEDADTVREALALVAPEALVAIDAVEREPVDPGVAPVTLALAGSGFAALAAVLWIAVRRRSQPRVFGR